MTTKSALGAPAASWHIPAKVNPPTPVKMIRTIHPFPARMAPELALDDLLHASAGALVLDPMAGSGTVLRHAAELGYRAIGVDSDPLAVLMSTVWTGPVDEERVRGAYSTLVNSRPTDRMDCEEMPWLRDDQETVDFMKFWFAARQRTALAALAFRLHERWKSSRSDESRHAWNVLRVALSRLVITKDRGASLARDVSHSRPHKVADRNDFDVNREFELSVSQVLSLLVTNPPPGNVSVHLGDARRLTFLKTGAVDRILTSPPYLNAIDYMRGHRLALVWLGYRLSDLGKIRSTNIGAERSPDAKGASSSVMAIRESIVPERAVLPPRLLRMIERYAGDLFQLMAEMSRVLKPGGRATFVVGNSCLRGQYIHNANGVKEAAAKNGLHLVSEHERELPNANRYLPTPKVGEGTLAMRMRTEHVVSFSR